MKLNKRNSFNRLKLIVFFAYNVAYALYMAGFMDRVINLAILALFLAMCIYQYLYDRKNRNKKVSKFSSEFKTAMVIVIVFLVISFIIQIIHQNIQSYVFSTLLYNIIPPVLAFFLINTTDKEKISPYFYFFFIRSVLYFLLRNGSKISIESIISIDWNDSKSSIFETPLAHDFLFLEIIFLYMKKTKLAIASAFLCILSFKRISFILSILFLLGYFVLGKMPAWDRFINKEVSKKTRGAVFIIFCIMPFVLDWMVSNAGINFFYEIGFDIRKFTTGRVDIIRFVQDRIGGFNGYGTSDYFMTHCGIPVYEKLGSMHCDLLKMYYEVTIIGVGVYAHCMIEIAKRKRIVFLMLLYLFMELISSHFLDALSVWNMFFIFAAYLYADDDKKEMISNEESQ